MIYDADAFAEQLRLHMFVQEQLAEDERLIAAAMVRGEPWVIWQWASGSSAGAHPQLAWDDLPGRAAVFDEHSRRSDGWCARCQNGRWPCGMVRTFLRRWELRPGFRPEWRSDAARWADLSGP